MWLETFKVSPSLKQIFSPEYIPLRISHDSSSLPGRGAQEYPVNALIAGRHYYIELLQTTP